MSKLQLAIKDKKGALIQKGQLEIKNQTESSAELYLYGDIISYSMSESYREYYPDDKCPKDIEEFLNQIGDVENLDIHINSGGGSVFGGIAIYNMLSRKKCTKTVYIDGIAASIASVIACCGDRIIVPKNATFMIHKPSNSYFWASMNADELRKDAELLDTCQKAILNTYMSKVKDGISEDKINELINAETWMVGNEVSQYFDFEIEESVDAVACTSDYFEKYANTPTDLKNTNSEKDLITKDMISELVDKRIAEIEKNKIEEQKNNLLKDLDSFGKR